MSERECQFCGRYMVSPRPNQKYCTACKKKAYAAKSAAYKAKAKPTAPAKPGRALSVSEVQRIADRLHLSYAKVSYKLANGEIGSNEFERKNKE